MIGYGLHEGREGFEGREGYEGREGREGLTWRIALAALSMAVALGTHATVAAQGPPQQKPTQPPTQPYEPQIGQAGKDVVWVPTPPELVDKMLDMAKVTPQDYVMDLGSGDGRNIIAAAKRGARATGVEYNPDMVELSRRLAREAGVADRATFVEGDMYTADISKATVMALFLLPTNLEKLRDKFLALKPGSRLVLNTFAIPEWEPDVTEKIGGDCASWCTSMLYIVPAQVGGTWKTPQGDLTLNQQYQVVSGVLATNGSKTPIGAATLRGDQLTLTVGPTEFAGKVTGERIEGTATTNGKRAAWTATRVR